MQNFFLHPQALYMVIKINFHSKRKLIYMKKIFMVFQKKLMKLCVIPIQEYIK